MAIASTEYITTKTAKGALAARETIAAAAAKVAKASAAATAAVPATAAAVAYYEPAVRCTCKNIYLICHIFIIHN